MISNFQKNKEKFTRLIEMAKEDKNIVIANSSKKNDSGLPNERYEDYKKLLQETEIRVISSYGTNSSNQKKEISLISTFDSDGLLDACFYEEEKGYKWMENPPQDGKIVENLYWEYAQGSDVCAYRQIEDNWNLYYFHQKCAN